jgi:putative redox protein
MTGRVRQVSVTETGDGPYAQRVSVGPHVMVADEREAVGGRDLGPSPYEILMAALGACTAMTVRLYAIRHSWLLQEISVVLQHTKLPAADGKTVDHFERLIHLNGNLTTEQRQRLLEIAEKCPVSQTLQRPSLIDSSLAESPAPDTTSPTRRAAR